MRVIDIVIGLGWIAFWIYWIVASLGAKAGRSRWTQFAGVREVGIALVVVLLLRLRIPRPHAVRTDALLQGIGLAVFVLGLALAVWARVYIGRNWGMPMSRKDNSELVTSGPYHTIRHPIYSGIILGMVGSTVAIGLYWLPAAAALGGYFVYSAVMEERYMAEQFPDTYPAYKRSTKMLIPFVL